MNWNELFDYHSGKLLWKVKPNNRVRKGSEAGYLHHDGYVVVRVNKVLNSAHRIIWEMHNGPIPKGMEIDHVNRNRIDNRIENLRLATRRQNSCNLSTNPSGVPGVYWCKQQGRWRARIFVNGKNIHLGLFKNINDAAKARMNADADVEAKSGAINL